MPRTRRATAPPAASAATPAAPSPTPTKAGVLRALRALDRGATDTATAHPIQRLLQCPDAHRSASLLMTALRANRSGHRLRETAIGAGGRREALVGPPVVIPPLC